MRKLTIFIFAVLLACILVGYVRPVASSFALDTNCEVRIGLDSGYLQWVCFYSEESESLPAPHPGKSIEFTFSERLRIASMQGQGSAWSTADTWLIRGPHTQWSYWGITHWDSTFHDVGEFCWVDRMTFSASHFAGGSCFRLNLSGLALDLRLLLALPGIPISVWLFRYVRLTLGARRGLCRHCSYNLTGNTSGVCPECGTAINAIAESPRAP